MNRTAGYPLPMMCKRISPPTTSGPLVYVITIICFVYSSPSVCKPAAQTTQLQRSKYDSKKNGRHSDVVFSEHTKKWQARSIRNILCKIMFRTEQSIRSIQGISYWTHRRGIYTSFWQCLWVQLCRYDFRSTIIWLAALWMVFWVKLQQKKTKNVSKYR